MSTATASPVPTTDAPTRARVARESFAGRLTRFVAIPLAALVIGACGSDSDDGIVPKDEIDKVTVDPTEAAVVTGKTVALTARPVTASGVAITGSGLQWSTSDAAVATVSNAGVVSGLATGVARITASANGRSGSSVVSVSTQVSQTVPPSGGTVSTPGGEVRVTLPNGALPAGGSVNIEPVTNGTAAGTTVPGTVYKIGVFGIGGTQRPTITVRYSVVGLPPGFDETKLTLSKKVGAFWIPLPSQVNTAEKTITAVLPAGMIASASVVAAAASAADEEATVGATLFLFEADAKSLQLTVGDRRRVTGHVRTLATGASATVTSANVSSSASNVASVSGSPTVSGTEVSVEVIANAAGSATITLAGNISSGGASAGFATEIPVTVAPASSLTVNVSGLPAGLAADLTITGPSNFSRKLTGSQNLGAVTPGTYTIAAANVSSANQNYVPNPATQQVTVNAGEEKLATVSYAPTLGSLVVSVTGLPSGVNASVTVTGPGGFSKSLSASETLAGLAAGSYTIAAANVTASGQLYVPAPTSQSATVVVGQSASATVAYAVGAGALTVNISGLPAGVAAKVTITGPNDFSRVVTASTTISALSPGQYNVTPEAVTANQQTYRPTATVPSVTVVAGQTTTLEVGYVATLGQLAVTVTGAGCTSSVDVRVTGPNGFTKQLTSASETLLGLAPGTYTVTAGNLAFGPAENQLICRPATRTQQINVIAGGSPTATVNYIAGYMLTLVTASGSTGSGTTTVSPAASSEPPLYFYPSGTSVTVRAAAATNSRVAAVSGPGNCTFAPSATDVTSTFSCSFAMTAPRTVTVTYMLLGAATIEKASSDSLTFKQSQGVFICCSAVRVRNGRGGAVPGVSVTWTTPGSQNPLTNTTDESGVAGGVGIKFSSTPNPGSYTLTATITLSTCESRSVVFTYFVVAGAIVGSTESSVNTTTSVAARPASGSGEISGGSTLNAAGACTTARIAPPSNER